MASSPHRASIALVGAGPRGASLIERIGANLEVAPASAEIDLHVIDDAQSGAGRIWRTDQTRELCMNTLAHAVTLFTEPGSSVAGPVRPGPTLYEWCLLVLRELLVQDDPAAGSDLRSGLAEIPRAHVETFESHPVRAGLAHDYRDELARTLPDSHPSRALYGEYLSWCYHRAVAALPAGVRVIRHRARAIGIERVVDSGRTAGSDHTADAGAQREIVRLSDGERIVADSVILATGWMPRGETAAERGMAAALADRPELTWVRPASPVDQDLDGIAPGSHAIVRGMGMGFFDTMALLTIGRGGRFVEDPAAPGGLRYEPSGREPILHVTSRRGVPFRAKTLYGSLPPSPEQRFALGVDWNAIPRPIDFDRQLWPRIVADAYFDYTDALRRTRPGSVTAGPEELRAAVSAALADLAAETDDADAAPVDLFTAPARIGEALAPFVPDPALRFDFASEMRPVRGTFESPGEFDAWVRDRVLGDLSEAALGHDSALKAGLWSISAARGVAGSLGTLGGFDAESRASGYGLLIAIGGMVGSGPPAFRNRQLVALAEQGLVHFIGPEARVAVSAHGFTASSPAVAGSEVTAPALIDAWMHFHSLAETADPLARSLLTAGRARSFTVPARRGPRAMTGAFDLDRATGLLIGADGSIDPAVHIAGIPVDEAVHGTIISPMPGTDPPMLRETDRVARSAIRIAVATHDTRSSACLTPVP
ncbi:FAD/NAD(P)-binding protein [Leucobacter celer]|uniref:FAD/NAD(P)-binding protein n=1 Tax=Leucobacter celer TaxID=668625 RepID=UPI0006A7BD11|nr:FAD/NAD(P)-binding protein [Leucobacter celer]